MRQCIQKGLLLSLALLCSFGVMAHVGPREEGKQKNNDAQYRNDCAPSRAEIDLNVNNVRARLQVGGDLFWDFDDGKYIVPSHDPALGLDDVSSIFAASVWLGGVLRGDIPTLKLAAQDYRSGNNVDFYPGPLSDDDGSTDAQRCREWDRFFRVEGDSIQKHIENFLFYSSQDLDYPDSEIPPDVKAWPAIGNPFFGEFYDFQLPKADQGLGNYWDEDGDGFYDPTQGDYPTIDVRGCEDPQYPDDMYFFVYNDAGNEHRSSGGEKIRMEVQVQAFGYKTQDEINNMTFYRYKLINRAPEVIDSMFFAMWVDPDLGCSDDDFIGCDTAASLMYVYNEDVEDGNTGTSCIIGNEIVPTYGVDIPILGIDYFRGPLSEPREQPDGSFRPEDLGMTSFTYYNRGVSNPPDGTTDPGPAIEYYRLLNGFWKDGTPYTSSGDGYLDPGVAVRYAFVDPPDRIGGWSMCEANLDFDDRRTLQTTGPFKLETGAVNELIIGVVWLPDIVYPCPSIEPLLIADQTAQGLFDNCFDILDGPDAPSIYTLELDRQVVFTMVNSPGSNNAKLEYGEVDPKLKGIATIQDSQYLFQGYRVFQLAHAAVEATVASFEDIDLSREVFKYDLKDNVSTIYNWESIDNPNSTDPVSFPVEKVDGQNAGIEHTFTVTNDAFASGENTRLINFKKYYYSVIAYAYNNYEDFDVTTNTGQDEAYIVGRHNVQQYIVVPRKKVDVNLNSFYGEGIEVSRLDGDGVINNTLMLSDATREDIVRNGGADELTWAPGGSPLNAKIYDPVHVKDGSYLLSFEDFDADPLLSSTLFTVINEENGDLEYMAETNIATLNEELINKLGISVFFAQGSAPGTDVLDIETNGFLGASRTYADNFGPQWYDYVDEGSIDGYNFIKNDVINEYDYNLDPEKVFSDEVQSGFYPFLLNAYDTFGGFSDQASGALYSPSWFHPIAANMRLQVDGLSNLNNVDIIFTSNKELWSRSVIVQTANYATENFIVDGPNKSMNVLTRPSVGTEADPANDSIPAELNDGTVGFGYFPGYAVDVETGKRLNIFFGENTLYSPDNPTFGGNIPDQFMTGNDRMWNPAPQIGGAGLDQFISGGQHYIFVTTLEYDGCQVIHDSLLRADNSPPFLANAFRGNILKFVSWSGFPLTAIGQNFTTYKEGLIPNDLTISLRVKSPFRKKEYTGSNNGFNQYRLKIEGKMATSQDVVEVETALDLINVVPNPYYAYSVYENSSTDNIVKITNLPQKCTVSIFSLDGKFIRRYNQNAQGTNVPISNAPIPETLYRTDIEWDLKNDDGIPIAGGVYFIHIEAPGLGERIIKWFGVNRKFDPSAIN